MADRVCLEGEIVSEEDDYAGKDYRNRKLSAIKEGG